jgi:hypothetical protein
MIRVKTMTSANNLLVIIVLTSVELVMTGQPSNTLDDQFQILSSSNTIRESAHRHPAQRNVFMKRGLVKRYHQKPMDTYSDYEYDHNTYSYKPSAVEANIR